MRRPSAVREALGFSPSVEARRADAARVERVPPISALAKPFVFLPGRPAAEGAADARRFGSAGLVVFFKLTTQDGRVGVSNYC
jgi:hypothetical protein